MESEYILKTIGSSCFALALLHTFLAGYLTKLSHKFKLGSVAENFFHLFGEVEIVFGLWSAVFVLFGMLYLDFNELNRYISSRNFSEALFVFVIMSICSTKPIMKSSEIVLVKLSSLIPVNKNISLYFTLLALSPLLGSFITEPAAMTISAFLLLPRFFTNSHSIKFKYATLALLFLNISIGGTITPYAAPPVLMVASKWGWDLNFMLSHFAIKTILAVFINTLLIIMIFKKEIIESSMPKFKSNEKKLPLWIIFIHLLFLILVVLLSHYPVFFIGLFLFFMGFIKATHEFQSKLSLEAPLLVAFFLAGLIVLGGLQQWWLEPIISSLNKYELFFGSIGLTAFTDNAALTYLGSLVPTLDFDSKLALVKGSVVGGGLTLIANAPNPAGYGILRSSFDVDGFSPLSLLKWSLPITIIAAIVFVL